MHMWDIRVGVVVCYCVGQMCHVTTPVVTGESYSLVPDNIGSIHGNLSVITQTFTVMLRPKEKGLKYIHLQKPFSSSTKDFGWSDIPPL